jgi:hypothetical protein
MAEIVDFEFCRFCGKRLEREIQTFTQLHRTGKDVVGVLHLDIRPIQCDCSGRRLGLAVVEGKERK